MTTVCAHCECGACKNCRHPLHRGGAPDYKKASGASLKIIKTVIKTDSQLYQMGYFEHNNNTNIMTPL